MCSVDLEPQNSETFSHFQARNDGNMFRVQGKILIISYDRTHISRGLTFISCSPDLEPPILTNSPFEVLYGSDLRTYKVQKNDNMVKLISFVF